MLFVLIGIVADRAQPGRRRPVRRLELGVLRRPLEVLRAVRPRRRLVGVVRQVRPQQAPRDGADGEEESRPAQGKPGRARHGHAQRKRALSAPSTRLAPSVAVEHRAAARARRVLRELGQHAARVARRRRLPRGAALRRARRRRRSSCSSSRCASIVIESPSATSAIVPPAYASGATWPTTMPQVPPEKRPSVTRPTDSPRPWPISAPVGASISGMPGAPFGPR